MGRGGMPYKEVAMSEGGQYLTMAQHGALAGRCANKNQAVRIGITQSNTSVFGLIFHRTNVVRDVRLNALAFPFKPKKISHHKETMSPRERVAQLQSPHDYSSPRN